MDSFLNNMNSILDKHAPLKKLTNIKESLRQNPGLLLDLSLRVLWLMAPPFPHSCYGWK